MKTLLTKILVLILLPLVLSVNAWADHYPDEGEETPVSPETWPYNEDTSKPPDYCEECDCVHNSIIKWMRALLEGEKKNKDGTCPKEGMAYYFINPYRASLRITDRPLGYRAPFGPGTRPILNYDSDDITAPANPRYSNLGPRWKLNFVQFIEVEPNATGIEIFRSGHGGIAYYTKNSTGPSGTVTNYSREKLELTGTQNGVSVYERRLPDGTVETYNVDGGHGQTGRERVFLGSIKDEFNNTVTLTWTTVSWDNNTKQGLQLTKITDATGKETTFSHEDAANPMRITKITDPLGRTVTIQYDNTGRLERLIDPVGVYSRFHYHLTDGKFISALETSYGTTTFERGDLMEGGNYAGRYLHVTDPEGRQSRLEKRLWVEDTEFGQEADPPTGFTSGMRSGRYTLYWPPQALAAGQQITNAYASQWAFDTNNAERPAVASFKAPLTNREWCAFENSLVPGAQGATGQATTIYQRQPDGTVHRRSGFAGAHGLPASRTDHFGRTLTYEYHGTTRNLHKVKHAYDVPGTSVETTLLTMEDYVQGRPGKITHADGTITYLYYNSRGQFERVKNALNEETKVIFDETQTSATYGRRTAVKAAFGTALERVTQFDYDAYCRLWKITNHEGDVTTFEYDAVGNNPLATLNRVTKVIHPDGRSERVEWELLHVKRSFDVADRMTEYERDDNGEVTSVTTPDGKTVQFVRDCCGGSLDTLIDAAGNKTHWKHDVLGRVTEKWLNWDPSNPGGNGAVRVQLHTYDAVGRPSTFTDARGNVRTIGYDTQGREDGITYALAQGTTKATPALQFTYDPVYNRIETVTDGTGTHTFSYVPYNATDTVYGDGQLGGVTTAGAQGFASFSHSYTYDKLGREVSSTLAGAVRSREWDALGRLKFYTTPLGITEHTFEGLSDRVSVIDAAGALTTSFGYGDTELHDRRLQAIEHRRPAENIPYSTFGLAYDELDRIKGWTKYSAFPGLPTLGNVQKHWAMLYDSSDQLEAVEEVTSTNGGAWNATDLHSYGYDLAGNRTSEQKGGGVRSWTANAFNQLGTQQVGGPIEIRGTVSESATIQVDNQPAEVWQEVQNGPWRWRVKVNTAAGQNTFAVQAAEADLPPGFLARPVNQTLEINLTPEPTVNYSYDADGNLLSDGITSYEWDAENRLVAATSSVGGRVDFAYDGFSRRVKISEPNPPSSYPLVTHLVWDGLEIVQQRREVGGALAETRDYFGNGERRSFPGASSVTEIFYTRDHLGSIREMVDKTSGLIHGRYDYSPYGTRTRIPTSGSLEGDFGFTGHYTHERTGLVLAPYRAYEPRLGRWTSRDPIEEDGGLNLHEYVAGRPIELFDEFGFQPGSYHAPRWGAPIPPPQGPPPMPPPGGGTWKPGGTSGDRPSWRCGKAHAHWDKDGHWDLDPGTGKRERYDWRGNRLPDADAHSRGRPPMPRNSPRPRGNPRLRGLGFPFFLDWESRCPDGPKPPGWLPNGGQA